MLKAKEAVRDVRTVHGPETMIPALSQLSLNAVWLLKLHKNYVLNDWKCSVLSCQFSHVCTPDRFSNDLCGYVVDFVFRGDPRVQTICNEAKSCNSPFQAQNKDLQSDATV